MNNKRSKNIDELKTKNASKVKNSSIDNIDNPKNQKSWSELIEKHPLRHDIWMILELYNELNVTEITHYVKQSKSTVSRVLNGMEEDELVLSRRGKKERGEKIPPKYYQINPKFKMEEYEYDEENLPKDPEKLKGFYLSEIMRHNKATSNMKKLIDYLTTLLKHFENQLEDIDKAKATYNEYLSGINEPLNNVIYFDKKRFKEFLDLRIEYMMKLQKLAIEQELDTENAFVYFDMSLPLSALFELTKKLKQK
ncbi:MAG: winged helix-turn-helix domain-containing protein [Candidatus Hermodarchaeota archaeon]